MKEKEKSILKEKIEKVNTFSGEDSGLDSELGYDVDSKTGSFGQGEETVNSESGVDQSFIENSQILDSEITKFSNLLKEKVKGLESFTNVPIEPKFESKFSFPINQIEEQRTEGSSPEASLAKEKKMIKPEFEIKSEILYIFNNFDTDLDRSHISLANTINSATNQYIEETQEIICEELSAKTKNFEKNLLESSSKKSLSNHKESNHKEKNLSIGSSQSIANQKTFEKKFEPNLDHLDSVKTIYCDTLSDSKNSHNISESEIKSELNTLRILFENPEEISFRKDSQECFKNMINPSESNSDNFNLLSKDSSVAKNSVKKVGKESEAQLMRKNAVEKIIKNSRGFLPFGKNKVQKTKNSESNSIIEKLKLNLVEEIGKEIESKIAYEVLCRKVEEALDEIIENKKGGNLQER